MYFSAKRTESYVQSVLELLESDMSPLMAGYNDACGMDVFVVPDHVTLANAVRQVNDSAIPEYVWIGAQDCYSEDAGSFTGEVSPAVLAEVGCKIVEVGHAERRRLFGETDRDVAAKAAAVLRNGMVPLVCVGEVSRPLGTNSSEDVEVAAAEVMGQVEVVLDALTPPLSSSNTTNKPVDVVLAYEPVWAIGAKEPAPVEHVRGVVRLIRRSEAVKRWEGRGDGWTVRIVYGGSAGPGLWEKLQGVVKKEGGDEDEEEEADDAAVDGLFLGRFAHDPEQFFKTLYEVSGA